MSHSRLYLANKCRRAYSYKYLEKLRPAASEQRADDWIKMVRGIVMHGGMEYGFLGEDPVAGIDACIKEQIYGSDQRPQGVGAGSEKAALLLAGRDDYIAVVQNAMEWLPASDWEPVMYKGAPMVEAELAVPLPGWKGFIGYADLVARHKPSGRVLVLDWKTRERFEADDVDRYNRQFAFYQPALGYMGVHCDGSLLVEIKPTPPRRGPRVTRIDDGGIDGVRISADGSFRTICTFRSKTYIENIWRNFEGEALELASLIPERAFPNMNGFNCGKCEFSRICQATLRGDDSASIVRDFYRPQPTFGVQI